ncbi:MULTISPECIES: hypothetical protein [unclassified Colwellia]|nr:MULTISPECIES: hypothetical protein [unclassified Colwellia]
MIFLSFKFFAPVIAKVGHGSLVNEPAGKKFWQHNYQAKDPS